MSILDVFGKPKSSVSYLLVDTTPLNRGDIQRASARRVNALLGMRDGGNVNVAVGRVLYPSEQNARRAKVLGVCEEFYAG